MNPGEWLGWVSSVILCLTIGKQIYKQYHDGTSEGVSKWLYLGQFSAEIGFITYSWMVRNWVFVFTNTVLLVENILGLALVILHRRKKVSASGLPRYDTESTKRDRPAQRNLQAVP